VENNKLIIPLEKRMGKAAFNIFMALGVAAICYTFISMQITSKAFSWWMSGLSLIFGAVALWMFYELSHLFKKSVRLVIEVSKPGFIKVYCEDAAGKAFHEQEEINVKSLKQIYVLKEKNTKGLNTDCSIEYILKKNSEKVTLSIFPGDLFSTSEQEMNKILHFFNQQNPEISLGY
jgi:hypothetical protein